MTAIDRSQPLPFDPRAGGEDTFLLAVSDACLDLTEAGLVLALTARALGERLGADRVVLAEFDGSERWLDVVADWHGPGVSDLERRQPMDPSSHFIRSYVAGKTVVFAGNPDESNAHAAEALAAAGMAALIAAPFIREGRIDALVEVNQSQPRNWTKAEVALVEAVAARTWRALDHHRTFLRLRDSEAQFRTLAESLPVFCWLANVDGEPFWHNKRAREHAARLGIDYADIMQLCHPDDIPDIYEQWGRSLATGQPLEMIIRIRGEENDWRPSLSQAYPVYDDNGRITRWCGVATDLSHQHAAEARRTFLMTLADRLRAETDVGVYIDVTAEILGRQLGVSRVCYSEIDPDDPRVFQVEREWNDGTVVDVIGRHRLEMLGDGLLQSHLRGETLIVDDIDSHPLIGSEAAPVLRRLGFVAGIDTPLVKAGRLSAILHVHSATPRRWTEEEIDLVKEVADRTWSGVERAKAEAHLEAQERDQRFLLALSDATRDVADPREILATTLAALGAHLDVSRANYAEADSSGQALEVAQDWVDGVASVAGARFPLEALGQAVLDDHLTGRPFKTDDVDDDRRFDAAHLETYRAVQAQAFISVPLVRAGRLTGVLSVQSAHPRRWSEREVRLMQEVAERNWATLERARSEERLRDSEEQFRTLAENLPNICFVTDREGRMLWENRAFHAFFGAQSGLHDRGDLPKVVAAADVPRADALWGQALASGEPLNLRLSLTGIEGRSTPFLTQTRPVLDGQGRIVRWCGVMTDLSDEEAREDRQAFLFSLAERLREERDPDQILHETARAIGERLGADRAHFGSLAGSRLTVRAPWAAPGVCDHAGEHDLGAFGLQALEAHRGGKVLVVSDVEAVIRDPQALAQFRALDIGGGVNAPLLMEGELVGLFTVQTARPRAWTPDEIDLVRDVAERGWAAWNRAVAETALNRSQAALAQSEKLTALGSLLAGVSHELNNPLSIIVAQSVMLERQSEGSILAERAQKIRTAADRCARIVQTFLAMARQKPPEREAVDLNEIAGAALDLAQYGLRASGVEVVRDFTAESTALSADGDQLHQVILNLITNAQQAMQDQAGERRLTVSTRREGDEVVLDVADTGPGVPPELAARIFEPFFTTKAQGEGTGFGLSFSHGIAAAHEGELTLVDSADQGACFRLRLGAVAASTASAGGSTPAPSIARRTALVVDDELEIAESLADLLDLAGFDCEVAHGGRAAQVRLGQAGADFDLILSDLRMPDIDGPALFDWIRAERPDMTRRVAFATGDTLGGNVEQFLTAARRPHVEKPVTPESLDVLLDRLGLEVGR